MDATNETLNGYIDWVATKTRATIARHPDASPTELVRNEILRMMDTWDIVMLRKRLAEYGIVEQWQVDAFIRRGFKALYTIAYTDVRDRKGTKDLRDTYRAMGYDEAFINLLFLVVVEYLIDKPYDEKPRVSTIHKAQDRVGDLIRTYLAEHNMTMPEDLQKGRGYYALYRRSARMGSTVFAGALRGMPREYCATGQGGSRLLFDASLLRCEKLSGVQRSIWSLFHANA